MARSLAAVVLFLTIGCTRASPERNEPTSRVTVDQTAVQIELVTPPSIPKPSERQEPSELLIATFNINFGNARLDLVREAIEESKADIVVLQEANEESETFLKGAFAANYPHHNFSGSNRLYLAGRFGILSRFPVVEATFVDAEHGLFGTPIYQVQFGGQELRLVNVHLTPFSLSVRDGLARVFARMGETEDAHRQEIELIHEQMLDRIRTVVLGDFNSLSSFAAPKFLREHGFTDSFAAVHDDADKHPTWEWPLGSEKLSFRLDYIFHDESFECVSSRVIRKEASDHHLVLSQLRLKINAKTTSPE